MYLFVCMCGCADAHTYEYPTYIPYRFVGNNMDFWHREPIERAGYWQGVGTHILKYNPISNRHHRQQSFFNDLVQSITSWTPDWWWNQLTEVGLYSKTRSETYVIRTNKMHTFFINDLIQLYCLWHVSNNQVFIFRKTCTCSFMTFFHAHV
jgi:hypothetical protein